MTQEGGSRGSPLLAGLRPHHTQQMVQLLGHLRVLAVQRSDELVAVLHAQDLEEEATNERRERDSRYLN